MAPTCSIGLAFHRADQRLRWAIASVVAQTMTDWELILTDDGADAADWLATIADPRVRLLRDGANRGLAARLNQQVAAARGHWFIRMDADDICHPQRLERLLPALAAHGDAGPLGSAAWAIDAANRVTGRKPAGGPQRSGWAARHSFIHPTVAAATAWFRANPYDAGDAVRRAEDADLWCRTSRTARFAWIDEPLLFYREVGVFSAPAYRATSRAMIEVARRQNVGGLGLHLGFTLRDAVHSTAAAVGLADVLVRRRALPVTADQRVQAASAVAQAINGDIPGLAARP